jgi:hypothetical protein
MIFTQVAGASRSTRVSPAAISSSTGSVTGVARVAVEMSRAVTAYPSMAELLYNGSGQRAVTSSARTVPSASSSSVGRGGSALMVSAISAW